MMSFLKLLLKGQKGPHTAMYATHAGLGSLSLRHLEEAELRRTE